LRVAVAVDAATVVVAAASVDVALAADSTDVECLAVPTVAGDGVLRAFPHPAGSVAARATTAAISGLALKL
jgi:hypothetical protein